MFNVKLINSISPVYEGELPSFNYNISADVDKPEAIIVRSADMHSYEVNKELLCVARAGAGYNNIPVDEFADKGIVAFNTPGANANAVKELAIAGMLISSRDIIAGVNWCDTIKNEGDNVGKLVEKGKSQFVGPELSGKTLGVIGLGAVGRLVANTCVSLGMHVLGHDPYISVDNAWQLSRSVEHCTDLDSMLSRADYISIHVPLTDSTKNMFNSETISKMKPNAVLMNYSRGGLVNSADVIAALESGIIRRYVTDFPDASLIGAKGVITIPHLGASTPESEDNCVVMASQQIKAYLETGTIINSVNYPNCDPGAVTLPRLVILHKNLPNVIQGILHTITASDENINIDNMLNKSRGQYACSVLDLDNVPSAKLVESVDVLDTVYRCRFIAK